MRKTGEILALLAVVLAGIPLTYMFASAIADGQSRAREAPLRAILGDDPFEALARGDHTQVHYLGNDRSAPDFSLTDRSGRPWRLSDHRGKVIVMNFWSITCQPCVEEMPSLIELSRLVKDRDDVEVVAVSTDESWETVSSLFPPDSQLRVLFDPERSITQGLYGTRLYPETWFVDTEGVIRLRVDGRRDWSTALVLELIESFES